MTAAFDCAPGQGAGTHQPPHVWAGLLESALSVATVAPSNAHVADVRRLVRQVPPAGLTDEWRTLVDSARRWLARVDERPVPVFGDLAVLDAAAAARPHPVHGWQRQHAAICGE